MHINNVVKNYLYDLKEYITWWGNELYIFGVKKIELLSSKKIIIKLLESNLVISGNSLKITKSLENELTINGEINEIKKELCNI